MKITVKTTQQKVFTVDANPEDTVATLKQKIFETQDHPIAVQKLIYSGKILTDEKTVESCGIKEKDFLVLMVSKPKPTPTPMPPAAVATPPPPPASSSTQAEAPAAPSQPSEPVAAPVAPPPSTTTQSQPPPANVSAFGDSFLSGAALQSTIDTLVNDMGFPREDVLRAMRASFNNADRAVEYLMNGIPADLEATAAAAAPNTGNAPAASAPAAPTTPSVPAAPPSNQPQNLFQLAQQQQQQQQQAGAAGRASGAGGAALDLAALRDNPQIQQLRDLIAQNPAMIQPLIQQLAAQNPALAQMIAQNPEALFQLLAPDGAELGEDGPIPPGAQVVSVTPEERAAIERLEALGFPRQAAIEAYFACDKNEELAANYLFESSFDDD